MNNGKRIYNVERNNKVSAIIKAATQLFLKNGYAGTSVDDIAAAVGMTRYSDALAPFLEAIFLPQTMHNLLGQVVAAHHPLTADEEAALLKAARAFDDTRKDVDNPRFHDLVLFLVRTGLRLDELRALEWTDIDFGERIIHIREKRVTETRIVKITKEVAPSLAQQIENKAPGDPLFPTKADIEAFGIRLKIRTPADLLKLKVADVSVDVSDNGDGTLLVDASYGGEGDGTVRFHNSYTPPTAGDVMSDLVQTGIDAMPYIAAAAICTIPAIARRRRRR